MSKIIVNKQNRYTSEALYQWDKNQDLVIYGLNIPDPEIHFTNEALVRTIPGEFSVDTTGIITARVPNSLLQKPYAITVFVCGYEGNTFKTYHKIRVPVKSRPQPADYTLELTDGEVYSFDSLSKRVADLEATVGTDTKATYYCYTVNGSGDALTEASKTTTIAGYALFVSQSLKAIKTVLDNLKNNLTNAITTLNEKHSEDITNLETRVTPIDKGGTGATTEQDAREKLGTKVRAKNITWTPVGSTTYSYEKSTSSSLADVAEEITVPYDNSVLTEYTHYRYVLKQGADFYVHCNRTSANQTIIKASITIGNMAYTALATGQTTEEITTDDYILGASEFVATYGVNSYVSNAIMNKYDISPVTIRYKFGGDPGADLRCSFVLELQGGK